MPTKIEREKTMNELVTESTQAYERTLRLRLNSIISMLDTHGNDLAGKTIIISNPGWYYEPDVISILEFIYDLSMEFFQNYPHTCTITFKK